MFIFILILAYLPLNHAQTGCPNPSITDDCDQCTSHDDPHIITLDGVRYDQHTDECFKYITTCANAANTLPFELCGCHYDCGNGGQQGEPCPSNIRCIGDITLTLFDSSSTSFEITVNVSSPSDDAYDVISASALTSGTLYTFDAANSHTFYYTKTVSVHEFELFSSGTGAVFYAHIRWSPGSLSVILNEGFFSDNTCGLCGYYNGIQADDFLQSDGTTMTLTPNDLAANPFPPPAAINSLINDFANSYLCDTNAVIPYDPGCTTTQDQQCVNETIACCEDLWDQIFATVEWVNPVMNEDEFMQNWLINCALDACALTYNNPDCDTFGTGFGFAKNVAIDTASTIYTVIPPQTSTDFESNCTAKVCAHGDNRMQLDVSYDSGSNWDLAVASEGDWKQTMTAVINPVDENTVLRFTVTDVSVVGGFIATIQLCGTNGYIFEFYTDQINTYFDVISDSAGDPLLDEFTPFGGNPWGGHVNPNKVECMNEEADWMWNDKTLNTMVFEVFLGHHLDILRRLDCVEEVTPAPTVDCCSTFASIDDYLDTCYCDSDMTTAPPTLSNTQATLQTANTAATKMKDTTGPTGSTLNTVTLNKAYSVGVNAMIDVDYKRMNEEMNQIKNMLYATWVIIIGCFALHMTLTSGWFKAKQKQFLMD
eukprot:176954_1